MPNIFNEAVEQDPMMLKFIPGQSMTQKMWKKTLDRSLLYLNIVSKGIKHAICLKNC